MTQPAGNTKIIDLEFNSEGHNTERHETVVETRPAIDLGNYVPFQQLTEAVIGGKRYHIPLTEALLNQPDAANILRTDIRLLAFTAFNANPRTFEGFTDIVTSNKPDEEYLRDAAIGVLSPAPSGTPAPEVRTGFEGGVKIANTLYRAIVEIPGDYIKFDQLGKIRQIAAEMGLAGRMTEEDAVYKYITTTGNYTRNSTTKDNDIGANQASTTFDADGVRTAQRTIATSKDRRSGAYLGYKADTFICGTGLEIPALMLFSSPALLRTHGSTTVEAIGTGTDNPFQGMIRRIIVSPWFGASYQWAMCDSTRGGFKFQVVEPFNVYQEAGDMTSEAWLVKDVIRYLIRGYFGCGFVDDRAWFYSPSTNDATVA